MSELKGVYINTKSTGPGENAIMFETAIYKAQTLVDHGFRVTLDLPESEAEAFYKIIQVYQAGGTLRIAAVPYHSE